MPVEKDVDERVWCPGPWPWQWFDTCIRKRHKWCYQFSWVKRTAYLFVVYNEACENGKLYTWYEGGLGIGGLETIIPPGEMCFGSPRDSRGVCDSSNTGLMASPLTADQRQADWRFCNKCYAMFYDGYEDKGICAQNHMRIIVVQKASELLKEGRNLIVLVNERDHLHVRIFDENGSVALDKSETDLARGDHLNELKNQLSNNADIALFTKEPRASILENIYAITGYANVKIKKGHVAQGFNFILPHDIPGSEWSQRDWRFCKKCHTIYFDGYPDKGTCSAGGGHEAAGYNFSLPHDVIKFELNQNNWRYCEKCHTMFYNGYDKKGVCPAGGSHSAQGFNFVLSYT